MMNWRRITRTNIAIALLALTLLVAIPAVAADSITLSISGEGRSASVNSASLQPVGYSHEDQTSNGVISLAVDDLSASLDGWNVTVQAGDFNAGERSIPADNFIIIDANAPVHIEGAEIDATGGPIVPEGSATGSLATPRKVLQANPGYGAGVYQQDLNVQLTVPGQTPAGEYSSNLTVNITAGP
jgi:hypothetical protein